MISRLTVAAVLLILGLLSLVTARPVSHEEAKKQDDLFTDKELDDLLKSCSLLSWYRITINSYYASCAGLFPSSNAEKQGFSASFTLPDGRTFEWGKEQGRRIPFRKGETQGTAQNAKEQGLTITLPDGNLFELGEEQGRRVMLPKEQSYTGNNLEDFLNGFFQPSKVARKQGISITLPNGNSFEFGKEQGRRVGWSHKQGRRVPFGEKQGRRVPFSEKQGRRVPFGEKQGIRVGWPYDTGFNPFYAKQQGRRIIPTTKQQDIQFPYPLYYYNTPISSKDKNIQAAIESIYNTAAIEALCSAASDKEKAAIVASYVQQNFDDLFDNFTDICDLLNGSGANGSTDKDAKGLSKELNKLLKDEK